MKRKQFIAACLCALAWSLTSHYAIDLNWRSSLASGAIVIFIWWVASSLQNQG